MDTNTFPLQFCTQLFNIFLIFELKTKPTATTTKNTQRNTDIFTTSSAPLFKEELFSLGTGSRQVLSSSTISHPCVQAVGTSPSGSHQKQQPAPVPTGQQHGFGSAEATANTGNLWAAWCKPGAGSASVCSRQSPAGTGRVPDVPKEAWAAKGLLQAGEVRCHCLRQHRECKH